MCLLRCVSAGSGPVCGMIARTKVVVRGKVDPVNMEHLRVGDHVLCVDGGEDLLTPGSTQWCEVMNFVSALENWVLDVQQLGSTQCAGVESWQRYDAPIGGLQGMPICSELTDALLISFRKALSHVL